MANNRTNEIWFGALRRCARESMAQPYMRPGTGNCQCPQSHASTQLYRCTCGLRLDEKCITNHIIEVYSKTGTIHYVMNYY